MKLAVALPVDSADREFVSGPAMIAMATTLERHGLDAAFVTDHPAPDDRWLANGGHHALEPGVALGFVAAATQRLRLMTNIYVLAYRNPLLAAKTTATLDALSDGRLILGVAAGYLRPEFAALGADFERRNDTLDESIALLRQAWTGQTVVSAGERWSARGATILPRPVSPGGPPVWCGGNSRRAMRRAVELGDGWMPFSTPGGLGAAVRTAEIASVDDLAARLELLDELCEQANRPTRPTICFTPPTPFADSSRFDDEMHQLGALGVEWLSVTLPCDSLTRWTEAVVELSERRATTLR